ncbi:hypothetical protein CASFOL_020917 [Castilleja foliolosa]|uniref:Neprosin PEP catalytic domain-containing protein n=1 Tax=Castilleja foliolosa TaxID=1961234 RepID=A0ABD3D613_9LAMI
MVSICCKSSTIIFALVAFLLFISSIQSMNVDNTTQSSDHPRVESEKLKYIRDYLKKINKPAIKTIQSPDGDIIDCVLSHQQYHPLLKGQRPLMASPQMSKWATLNDTNIENFQFWRILGESCPENTVPIRRITEEDVLRASSVQRFGRKLRRHVRKESDVNTNIINTHEYGIVYVEDSYYGASAVMDVWAPKVEGKMEFSLSQIWVMAGPSETLNTIEAGWQVFPDMYKDNSPRLFTYWTWGYHNGCYNLVCPGFVQISRTIVPGAAIKPVSSYNNKLYDLPFYIYKDSKNGNWWLEVNHVAVGYWPSKLFTHLQHGPANMIQFGGEIVNKRSSGTHTKTEMGSGHFPNEWYGKAACFKSVQAYHSMDGRDPANLIS